MALWDFWFWSVKKRTLVVGRSFLNGTYSSGFYLHKKGWSLLYIRSSADCRLSAQKIFCGWQFICFLGKWILTKEYIINSAESGRWLDETTYEWGYEIEKDTHYSPQMQSAPKRWREELTLSGAPGAFHRWKVVLPVKEGDKRMASIRR